MPWSWTLWKSKQKGLKGSASLSFSFSCANDVMPDHSCFLVAGVQVGATADCNRLRIRAVPKTRRKERRRDAGTNIHNRRGLPELPQPQVLHTIFNWEFVPPLLPPTSRHLAAVTGRMWTWVQGQRLCSLSHFESSGDFMQYLAEMLGQELVWSPFRQWGRGKKRSSQVCRLEGVWTRFRPKIISCLEQWRGGYAWSIGPWGNEKIMVEIQDKASVGPY